MKDLGKNYDAIAHWYASVRESYTEKKYLDLIIKLLPPKATVLDVGCGSGHPVATYLFANKLEVTGMDASKKLLAFAKKKLPHMHLIHADMRTIKLHKKFDAVIAWDSFFHLSHADQKKMIARFAEWLTPDGILLFTTGDTHGSVTSEMEGVSFFHYSHAPQHYKEFLDDNRFVVTLSEHDQNNHLVWMAKKRD